MDEPHRGDGVRRGAAKQGSSLGRGSRLALLERCRGARCDAAGTQRRKKIERRCARSVTTRMRLRCMTRRRTVSAQRLSQVQAHTASSTAAIASVATRSQRSIPVRLPNLMRNA